MNAREETNPPWPVQPYRDQTEEGKPISWGMWGWEGMMIDNSIGLDAVEALQWFEKHGALNKATQDLGGRSLVAHCRSRKATKCADYLKQQGYPE